MNYNIAIVGATGAVGNKMLETLYSRKFPFKNITLLASSILNQWRIDLKLKN